MVKRLLIASAIGILLLALTLSALPAEAIPMGNDYIILDGIKYSPGGFIILRPNAAGDATWLNRGGDSPAPTNWESVDEATADDDTTFVFATIVGAEDLYKLPASTDSGAIDKITVYARVRVTEKTTCEVKISVKSGSTTDYSATKTIAANDTWETVNNEWATNPDDSEAWERPDIDDLQIGFQFKGVAGEKTDGTQIYVEVDYTASDISGATFYSIITASNTNAEADDVFTIFSLGTQDLIDAGFLNTDVTDCAMHDTAGIDTAFMPSVNATYPWCFYVNHIGEDAFKNYLLYTGGNTNMGGKIRYFPGAGGMTSTDNDTLELSANFTIEQKGWIDTDNGTDKNLVYKQLAFRLYVSPTVSENITAAILGWTANFTETKRPDGHDTCVIPSETGAACNDHYLNVDEAGGGDDGATTVYCSATGATTYTDIYTLEDTSINATSQIMKVQTTIKGEITGNGQYRVGLKLGDDTTWGAFFTDAAWASHDEVLARPGGGSWQPSDLDGLKIMVYVVANGAAGNDATVTQCYITTTFQNPVETIAVTATGVESGEHTIKVMLHQDVALDFDGISHLVAVADSPTLDISANLTIEVWARMTRTPTANAGLVAKDHTGVGGGYGLYSNAVGLVLFRAKIGANWETVAFTTTLEADVWHHLVATYDGSNMLLYTDGDYEATEPASGAISLNNRQLKIGSQDSPGEWFGGLIDEVRIYSRALSPDEIDINYSRGRIDSPQPSDTTSLEAWWHIDEAEGAATNDETVNNNDGTITGAIWWNQSFKLYVDNILRDTSANVTVPDSDYDWTFIENYSMPYMKYHKIWIDTVLQQHIEYEYDDTVFSDLSEQSHPAYPTFRTASSDANVSAVLASFRPIEEAQAPAWVLEAERDFWDTENITATGEFTTTPTPTAAPGIDIIEAISAASGTPTQLPFNVIAGFVILAVSLTATWFLAKQGSRNIWLKIILITICMAVCVAVRVFDFWMVVFFLIMAIAVALFSRQRSAI